MATRTSHSRAARYTTVMPGLPTKCRNCGSSRPPAPMPTRRRSGVENCPNLFTIEGHEPGRCAETPFPPMNRLIRMSFLFRWTALTALACGFAAGAIAAAVPASRAPIARAVDLDVNEAQEVTLGGKTQLRVKLLSVAEARDPLRDAVRQALVKIEINGQSIVLTSATYHLPVQFAGVQVDCPITKGHVANSSEGNAWGLLKEARLRLWPGGSPWIEPGTFVYPLKQRWFASHTQMANEPSFVDGGEAPANKKIYYHYGLDSGGAEGMVEVVSATAGRVISSGKEILPGYDDSPVKPRYDVVYLLDDRGWYYRYSHLQSIDPAMQPGAAVTLGSVSTAIRPQNHGGGPAASLCFRGQQSCARRVEIVERFRQNRALRLDIDRRNHRHRGDRRTHLRPVRRVQRNPQNHRRAWRSGLRFRRGAGDRSFRAGSAAAHDSSCVCAHGEHPRGRLFNFQSAKFPDDLRQRDLGFRRWHGESHREIRRQCRATRQGRLRGHPTSFRQTGPLPGAGRANE